MNAIRVLLLAALAAGFCQIPVAAQGPQARMGRRWRHGEAWSPLDQLERLRTMDPEQRERLLSRLPPPRRANIERHLQRYMSLTPEQRARLWEQYEMFRQLAPERQQEFRRLFVRFLNQPPERQDVMREEFQRLRRMSPQQRAARLGSNEFHYKFQPNERDIIERMVELLP